MSFRKKIILGIAAIEAVLLGILIFSGIAALTDAAEDQIQIKADITASLLGASARDAVIATDLATLSEIAAEAATIPNLKSVRFLSEEGGVLAETIVSAHAGSPGRSFNSASAIMVEGVAFGSIEVVFSDATVQAAATGALERMGLIAGVQLLLLSVFIMGIGRSLTRRLDALKVGAMRFGAGDFGYRIVSTGKDELSEAASVMNTMADQIGGQTTELQQRASEYAALAAQYRGREAKLSALIDQTSVGITTTARDGSILQVNAAICEMLGYDEAALQEKRFTDLTHPDDQARNLADHRRLCDGEVGGYEIRQRYIAKDGSIVWVETNTNTVRNSAGQPEYFVNVVRNITDRVEAEAKLKERENVLGDAVEALDDGFVLYDADGCFVLSNERYREIYSDSADLFIVGRPFEEILRLGILRGQYDIPKNDFDGWVSRRLEAHRDPGEPFEQELADGRIIRISERRMSNGWRVGIRTDVTEQRKAEQELRRLAEAIDALDAGFLLYDADEQLIMANQEVKGRDPRMPAIMRPGRRFEAVIEDVVDTGIVSEACGREVAWLNERLIGFRNVVASVETQRNGKWILQAQKRLVDGSIAIFEVDISELKKAQNDLQEYSDHLEELVKERAVELAASEARLRAILDYAPSSIAMKDRDGRYVIINRSFANRRGLSPDNIIGKTTRDIYPEHMWKRIDEQDRNVFETMRSKQYELTSNEQGNSCYYIGSRFPIMSTEGEFIGLGAIFDDITELRQAEQKLKVNEALHRALLDHTPASISLRSLDGRYITANKAFYRLMQPSASNVIGKSLAEVFPESQANDGIQSDAAVLNKDQPIFYEYTRHDKARGEIHLASSKFPVIDDAGVLIAVGTVRWDITERKSMEIDLARAKSLAETRLDELERAKNQLVESEKLASLGGLVAGVAHEINTPIGVALTAASHLRDRSESTQNALATDCLTQEAFEEFMDTAGEATGIIVENLNRGADLIRSFKQVSADQSVEQLRAIELVSYIGSVLQTLSPQIRKSQHHIELIGDPPITINTFPGTLAQIISNLTMNALDHAFADQREGRMRISVECGADDTVLRFQDDGKGIDEAIAAKIFDPFFTTKRDAGNTGLGLNIVYNLVAQKLGGTISCDSAPGHGTTFTISLPVRSSDQEVAAA